MLKNESAMEGGSPMALLKAKCFKGGAFPPLPLYFAAEAKAYLPFHDTGDTLLKTLEPFTFILNQ